MSRRFLLILIVILMLGSAGGAYWYFFIRTPSTTGATTPTFKNFLPFGIGSLLNPSTTDTNTGGATDTTTNNNGEVANTPTNKLTKITNFAVAGATFFEDTRPLQKVETSTSVEQVITPVIETPVTIIKSGSKAEILALQKSLNEKNKGLIGWIPLKEDGVMGLKTQVAQTWKPSTAPAITTVPTPEFELVPSLRYVERGTGHIFQKYLDTNKEGKISNSTIPSIYEAIFGGEAKNLIYRYLSADRKTISSFLGTLGTANGEFLTENISDISVSPNKTNFFYLSPSSTGVIGTIRAFNETKKTQIFTSSFTEWLSQWPTSQTIFLTTKASYSELGYVYSLNTSSGAFNAVFGGIQGLTTLGSPNGTFLLYSSSTNSGPKLGLFNISTRENTDLNLKGLPEKCVWGADSTNIYCGIPNYIGQTEPDSWYQGLTSFNDDFVKINSGTGSNTIITQPTEEGIDATHLFLDNKQQTLYFINKKDSTLWSLDLN